jgi:hypothetical protein
VVVTIVLTFFTLVIGELAPKRVALQGSSRRASGRDPMELETIVHQIAIRPIGYSSRWTEKIERVVEVIT